MKKQSFTNTIFTLEGQVDVTVESDLGTTTIENGFTYTNAAPEDTDTDTQDTQDTQDTGTAQSTGLTGVWLKCGARSTPVPLVLPLLSQQTIELRLHSYTSTGILDLLVPPLNSCVSVLNYPI